MALYIKLQVRNNDILIHPFNIQLKNNLFNTGY